jgi:two-component system, OmpR family, osmolarity sensor histidine kinase EnvZ
MVVVALRYVDQHRRHNGDKSHREEHHTDHAVANSQRGMEHAPKAAIDCGAWLSDRAQQHAELAQVSGSSIRVTCDHPAWVQVDPHALGRVIDNLLGNALRYAPGAVDLVAEASAETVRIGVLDRGPGIPPAQRAAVWQPFHRLEPSRNAHTGGWGLGLSIVRQLARAHGWQVDLHSRDGGGLAAWVTVPRAATGPHSPASTPPARAAG